MNGNRSARTTAICVANNHNHLRKFLIRNTVQRGVAEDGDRAPSGDGDPFEHSMTIWM